MSPSTGIAPSSSRAGRGITALAGAVTALAFTAACSAPSADEASETPPPSPEPEIAATGTAVDDGTEQRLCVGIVNPINDPSTECHGLPLAGVDWDTLEDVQTTRGVRSTLVTLAGTYDGDTLSVTRVHQDGWDDASGGWWDGLPTGYHDDWMDLPAADISEADMDKAERAVIDSDADLWGLGGQDGVMTVSVVLADERNVTAIHDAARPWLDPENISIESAFNPIPPPDHHHTR